MIHPGHVTFAKVVTSGIAKLSPISELATSVNVRGGIERDLHQKAEDNPFMIA
jgi:hypothetical protein